jgi:hypothetical protein
MLRIRSPPRRNRWQLSFGHERSATPRARCSSRPFRFIRASSRDVLAGSLNRRLTLSGTTWPPPRQVARRALHPFSVPDFTPFLLTPDRRHNRRTDVRVLTRAISRGVGRCVTAAINDRTARHLKASLQTRTNCKTATGGDKVGRNTDAQR